MNKTIFLLFAFLGSSFATAETRAILPAKTKVEMGITDDGVMGGLSKGKVSKTDQGTYLFSGTLSLENNGGFSSLRMSGGDWNLDGWEGIEIEVKGDGRTYDLRLTTDEKFRGSSVSFSGKFETKKGEWTKVRVPFSALEASWRGMNWIASSIPPKSTASASPSPIRSKAPSSLNFVRSLPGNSSFLLRAKKMTARDRIPQSRG